MSAVVGNWFGQVPKLVPENMNYRRNLLRRAERDETLQRDLWQACAGDLLFWVNSFVWTFDPREEGEGRSTELPLVTWPAQDDLFRGVAKAMGREDVTVEKSRDEGASWICLLSLLHPWWFRENLLTFMMMSRKEALVDSVNPDSLFWKVDFVLKHMPSWLVPEYTRQARYLCNDWTGSTIDGTSTTGEAGTGGRKTAFLLDEFALVEDDWAVLAATADVTKCRIFNSTHAGQHTAFYHVVKNMKNTKLRIHWSSDPRKNQGLYQGEPAHDDQPERLLSRDEQYPYPADFPFVYDGRMRSPWYDDECQRRTEAEVAQQLDINPQGAVGKQYFNPDAVDAVARKTARAPTGEGDVLFHFERIEGVKLVEGGGFLRWWCKLDDDGKPSKARYGMGVDPAAGTGASNSVISLVDCKTGWKVCEFACPNMLPERLANHAVALARLFKDDQGHPAYMVWEANAGPGQVFGAHVVKAGFRYFYYRTQENSLGKKESDKPGWYSTTESKALLLGNYRNALLTRSFQNPSQAALDECKDYIYLASGEVEHSASRDGNDPSGARAQHGDRVIADALANLALEKFSVKPELPVAPAAPQFSYEWRRQLRVREQEQATEARW